MGYGRKYAARVAEALDKLRKEAKAAVERKEWTVRSLAEALRINRVTLSKFLGGNHALTWDHAEHLAKLLNHELRLVRTKRPPKE